MNMWDHAGAVNWKIDWRLATAFRFVLFYFKICAVCAFLRVRDIFTILYLFKTNSKHFPVSLKYFK